MEYLPKERAVLLIHFLQLYEDINDDSLVIRYSWSPVDKLKTTKNNEPRVVEVPFPYVIDSLRNIAESNPHGVNRDSFVFWASKSRKKPMEQILFLKGLRSALIDSGLTESQANEYDFHSWRHFFTTYMRDKLDDSIQAKKDCLLRQIVGFLNIY